MEIIAYKDTGGMSPLFILLGVSLPASSLLLSLHEYCSPLSYPRWFYTQSIQIPTSQRCNGVNPQASST